MQIYRSSVLAAYVILTVGCSSEQRPPSSSDADATPTPPLTQPALHANAPKFDEHKVSVPVAALGSIADLVRRARERHPTTEALSATRDAAIARERTASAWANPELGVHVGRTHPRQDGFDRDMPYGLSLTQRLEWTGKRSARQRAAVAATAVTQADALATVSDLEAEVRLSLLSLGVAREEVKQAHLDATLADEIRTAIEKGHAAGDRDTASWTRAKLEAATAQVRRKAAERTVATARAVLHLWCGDDVPEALPLADVLPTVAVELDHAGLGAAALHDPRLAALTAAMRAADAQSAAVRSAQVPDVTVGVFAERDDEADTLGLSLGFELPTWNQQAGPIAEAEAQRRLAAADLRKRQVEQRLALAAIVGDYETARAQAESLRTTVLPLAEETLRLRLVGFSNGDFPLTDLLEARRALLTTHLATLDARRRTAETLVRLGQVVGRYDLTALTPQPTTFSPEISP